MTTAFHDKTLAELSQMLAAGQTTSTELTRHALAACKPTPTWAPFCTWTRPVR